MCNGASDIKLGDLMQEAFSHNIVYSDAELDQFNEIFDKITNMCEPAKHVKLGEVLKECLKISTDELEEKWQEILAMPCPALHTGVMKTAIIDIVQEKQALRNLDADAVIEPGIIKNQVVTTKFASKESEPVVEDVVEEEEEAKEEFVEEEIFEEDFVEEEKEETKDE